MHSARVRDSVSRDDRNVLRTLAGVEHFYGLQICVYKVLPVKSAEIEPELDATRTSSERLHIVGRMIVRDIRNSNL